MHDIGLSCLWRFWRCAEGMWPFSGRALRRADVGSRKSPVSLGFLMPVCFLMPRNRHTLSTTEKTDNDKSQQVTRDMFMFKTTHMP